MVHKKIPDFITTEISLWSGKLVLNNLLSLNIAFWFVRKLSMQVGLWNWKYVSSFIRGDKSNICIKFCKWEFSTDILKSSKISMCSYWADYLLIIALIASSIVHLEKSNLTLTKLLEKYQNLWIIYAIISNLFLTELIFRCPMIRFL